MAGYYGGQNKIDIARVKISSGAYVKKQIDGVTAATSAAHCTRLSQNVKVDKPRNGRLMDFNLDQTVGGEDFETLIKNCVVAPNVTTDTTISKVVYVDGTSEFGDSGANTGELVAAIDYGPVVDGKIKVVATIGNIAADSGSESEEATNAAKPKFGIKGVKAAYDLDLKALLDTAIVDAPAGAFQIDAGYGYVVAFLDAA